MKLNKGNIIRFYLKNSLFAVIEFFGTLQGRQNILCEKVCKSNFFNFLDLALQSFRAEGEFLVVKLRVRKELRGIVIK